LGPRRDKLFCLIDEQRLEFAGVNIEIVKEFDGSPEKSRIRENGGFGAPVSRNEVTGAL
jgi:hypothetical protein